MEGRRTDETEEHPTDCYGCADHRATIGEEHMRAWLEMAPMIAAVAVLLLGLLVAGGSVFEVVVIHQTQSTGRDAITSFIVGGAGAIAGLALIAIASHAAVLLMSDNSSRRRFRVPGRVSGTGEPSENLAPRTGATD
jgi:hypothetical protein